MKIELHISPTEDATFKIKFDMETGIVTTVDNEGLVNQEKLDKTTLPSVLKSTVNRVLDKLEM